MSMLDPAHRRDPVEKSEPFTKLRMFLDSASITNWELWMSTRLFYGEAGTDLKLKGAPSRTLVYGHLPGVSLTPSVACVPRGALLQASPLTLPS